VTMSPPTLRSSASHLAGVIPNASTAHAEGSGRPERPGRGAAAAGKRPDVRSAVLRRWKKVLGQDLLAESWSEAGGDSLKLFEFVLPLERELQCTLPFDLFHGDMRVEDAVACIERAIGPPSVDLPDGRKRTVFLLPGIGGDEPLLAGFRHDLKDQVRFVVLTYPGLSDLFRPGFTFDRIVDAVCGQIAAESPEKEVRLAGYSFGGLVAYAAALRLRDLGWRIRFLGILDTNLQLSLAEALRNPRGPMQRAHDLAAEIRRRGVFSGLIFKVVLQPRLRLLVSQLARIWRPTVQNSVSLRFRQKAIFFLRWDAALRWLRELQPVRIPTCSAVFRSEEYAADETAEMGWGALLHPLTVVQVSGDHHSMFRHTGDATLAKQFFDALMAAESEPNANGDRARLQVAAQ
jgi:thioesterase domain-containing protein/acyl carrier protein